MFPAEDQKAVPVLFGLGIPESPNPLPPEAGQSRVSAGYPVTVTFPRRVRIRNVKATLAVKRDSASESSSNEVPAWVSSPEKPAIQNSTITQGNTICIISKAPLNGGNDLSCHSQGRSYRDAVDTQLEFHHQEIAVGTAV